MNTTTGTLTPWRVVDGAVTALTFSDATGDYYSIVVNGSSVARFEVISSNDGRMLYSSPGLYYHFPGFSLLVSQRGEVYLGNYPESKGMMSRPTRCSGLRAPHAPIHRSPPGSAVPTTGTGVFAMTFDTFPISGWSMAGFLFGQPLEPDVPPLLRCPCDRCFPSPMDRGVLRCSWDRLAWHRAPTSSTRAWMRRLGGPFNAGRTIRPRPRSANHLDSRRGAPCL